MAVEVCVYLMVSSHHHSPTNKRCHAEPSILHSSRSFISVTYAQGEHAVTCENSTVPVDLSVLVFCGKCQSGSTQPTRRCCGFPVDEFLGVVSLPVYCSSVPLALELKSVAAQVPRGAESCCSLQRGCEHDFLAFVQQR